MSFRCLSAVHWLSIDCLRRREKSGHVLSSSLNRSAQTSPRDVDDSPDQLDIAANHPPGKPGGREDGISPRTDSGEYRREKDRTAAASPKSFGGRSSAVGVNHRGLVMFFDRIIAVRAVDTAGSQKNQYYPFHSQPRRQTTGKGAGPDRAELDFRGQGRWTTPGRKTPRRSVCDRRKRSHPPAGEVVGTAGRVWPGRFAGVHRQWTAPNGPPAVDRPE